MRVGIRLRRDQLDAYEEDPNDKDYLPYSDWGHTGAAGRKASKYDEDYVREIFGMLHDTYIAKEAVDVLIKGWCTENASYTLQSVYDSAPRFP